MVNFRQIGNEIRQLSCQATIKGRETHGLQAHSANLGDKPVLFDLVTLAIVLLALALYRHKLGLSPFKKRVQGRYRLAGGELIWY